MPMKNKALAKVVLILIATVFFGGIWMLGQIGEIHIPGTTVVLMFGKVPLGNMMAMGLLFSLITLLVPDDRNLYFPTSLRSSLLDRECNDP